MTAGSPPDPQSWFGCVVKRDLASDESGVRAELIITVIGIPIALAIGVWTATGKWRTFKDLRAKSLQVLNGSVRLLSAS